MEVNRRNVLKTMGLGTLAAIQPMTTFAAPKKKGKFTYCLNTSTIRGQNPGLAKYIEIAAEAGYDGIEIWIQDLQKYLADGNSTSDLASMIKESGLKVENAIGFAPWMATDEEKSKQGFKQMEEEMNLLAAIGCHRVAAPGIGAEAPVDLFSAGQKFKELIKLGRKTGVMPQLEFWGAFKPFHHLGQILMVAAIANDPDARLLPDIYHLFRGGSDFEGLKLIAGNAIEIFHMNDFTANIPREEQADKDRVYPGDGVGPLVQVVKDLQNMGGDKVLSLELFNPEYWKQDPLLVAKTGLSKMKSIVKEAS
ncbi:MAG: sugar phosphate isomerase/epimerase [Cytophagales bacterium]|uniref:sugar phosphate isomerase/epimerase family protein n=1 Tax=Cyclobacterium marinum TaxID=104 RepID=UPI0011ED5AD4|nr:sugar phosphate isomerase/epimerase [Cyclobacterium marinum]MBI0399175.1 sugar phosphate isomerase/epimerase [Cyclobacterium marinum]MBR9775107.1 sugar phosphate isomerase/epimerase [Cytophagales bacterium]|tara:strand:- start:8764 stop:9687 length:924 start_codon:yes stop_codon:yes gene_type:complete